MQICTKINTSNNFLIKIYNGIESNFWCDGAGGYICKVNTNLQIMFKFCYLKWRHFAYIEERNNWFAIFSVWNVDDHWRHWRNKSLTFESIRVQQLGEYSRNLVNTSYGFGTSRLVVIKPKGYDRHRTFALKTYWGPRNREVCSLGRSYRRCTSDAQGNEMFWILCRSNEHI